MSGFSTKDDGAKLEGSNSGHDRGALLWIPVDSAMGQVCACLHPRQVQLKKRRKLDRRHSDSSGEDESDAASLVGFESGDDGDEIHILIDGEDERDALMSANTPRPAVVTKRLSKSAALRMQVEAATEPAAIKGKVLGDTPAPDPLSATEEHRNLDVLRSYQQVTGVVDQGQLDLECVMCLDTFSEDNPKTRTLCNCGVNRTNFHLSCLLEWLNRDTNCPVCRHYLFYEEP